MVCWVDVAIAMYFPFFPGGWGSSVSINNYLGDIGLRFLVFFGGVRKAVICDIGSNCGGVTVG